MDAFTALAEPTRRNIMEMLAASGNLSATDIYKNFKSIAAGDLTAPEGAPRGKPRPRRKAGTAAYLLRKPRTYERTRKMDPDLHPADAGQPRPSRSPA